MKKPKPNWKQAIADFTKATKDLDPSNSGLLYIASPMLWPTRKLGQSRF